MIEQRCDSAVETRYHLLTALHVVQRRPVDILQCLSQLRLAVRVLATSDHHNVLASLTLYVDITTARWSDRPILGNTTGTLYHQSCRFCPRPLPFEFEWVADDCCITTHHPPSSVLIDVTVLPPLLSVVVCYFYVVRQVAPLWLRIIVIYRCYEYV